MSTLWCVCDLRTTWWSVNLTLMMVWLSDDERLVSNVHIMRWDFYFYFTFRGSKYFGYPQPLPAKIGREEVGVLIFYLSLRWYERSIIDKISVCVVSHSLLFQENKNRFYVSLNGYCNTITALYCEIFMGSLEDLSKSKSA